MNHDQSEYVDNPKTETGHDSVNSGTETRQTQTEIEKTHLWQLGSNGFE